MPRLSTRPLGNSPREPLGGTRPPGWAHLSGGGAVAATSGATRLSHLPLGVRQSGQSAPSLPSETLPTTPQEPHGGGGEGGAGLSLKGARAAALRPLPGGGEDLSGFGDTRGRRRRPGTETPGCFHQSARTLPARAEYASSPPGGYKAAPPSAPVSSASIFCDPRRQPGLASEWPQSPGWTRPRRQRSARGLRSQPFRVGPVLATVTCWLDSGNPLSEEHRGESLTTANRIRPDLKLPSPLWLPSAFFIPSLSLSGISVP
ncbi:protein piccolo-like [Cebus imitator]|uniref:protein piccolo-like n=1 Tax=Cebus imitator TaxID=2715852 RepID=UPI0018981483|nr:protein piccolo-like [Cebus imitator]